MQKSRKKALSIPLDSAFYAVFSNQYLLLQYIKFTKTYFLNNTQTPNQVICQSLILRDP